MNFETSTSSDVEMPMRYLECQLEFRGNIYTGGVPRVIR